MLEALPSIRSLLKNSLFPPEPPTERQRVRKAWIEALNREGVRIKQLPPNPALSGQRPFDPALDPLLEDAPIDNLKGTSP